ncbi:MAG: hypothetical protein ACEPOV_14780 [Hyphomicrobiales bacterium]
MQIRRLYIGLILIIITFSCNSQNLENKKFNDFLNKFKKSELPIATDTLSINIELTINEAKIYLSKIDSEFWKFEDNFYYYACNYLFLKKSLKGLIFSRVFDSGQIHDYRQEYILVCIDENREFISSIVIGGSSDFTNGNEITFFGELNLDYEISIKKESYIEGNTYTEERKFKIDPSTGEISQLIE